MSLSDKKGTAFEHEFPPTQDACCIHCHLPQYQLLYFDIKCSGPQSSEEVVNVTQ